ncbi:MAG: YraN family protein [Myxococcales bacterium]|nr:YraN family protein [Myxococcales bacterium]
MNRRALGNEAERRAAQHLERLGYRILERNYTCRLGEIDLVVEEGAVLCFVEVRMRTGDRHGAAVETISPAKRRHITRAAEHYLMSRGAAERACRFDVVTIDGEGAPVLIRDAFGMED